MSHHTRSYNSDIATTIWNGKLLIGDRDRYYHISRPLSYPGAINSPYCPATISDLIFIDDVETVDQNFEICPECLSCYIAILDSLVMLTK
jgi:hypothetical protein